MSATYPTKVFLAMKSGDLCALEDCRKRLTSEGEEADPAVIGEAAHIYGEHGGTKKKVPSARYNKEMTDEQRNHFDNLLYLCPSCHTKIDKQEEDYPADDLIQLKKRHEEWVRKQLDDSMSDVAFAELEIAAKAISSGKHASGKDYVVIPPEEKILKNNLGFESRSYIAMGLSRSGEVTKFLSDMAKLDDEFPQRVTQGFKQEYVTLSLKYSGDDLFMSMLEFSQNGFKDFKTKAAGLALLSHLFHICEVFKK